MAEHSCPDCGLVHDVSTPITPGGETNEHDVAIAEAETEAIEAVAEAGVEIAKLEAEARVDVAEAEAAARVDESEVRAEAEVDVAEVNADARQAEAEAEVAQAEALVEVADAAADVAIAEAAAPEATEPMHEEPDGDEAPEVVAVAVPPQIQEGGRQPVPRKSRTVSRFAARRAGHR
jgi:hypothetical protein